MLPRRRCHVDTLVVASAARRRGVGRALLEALGGWARSRGAAELLLTIWAGNLEAEAFYERLGYRTLSSVRSKGL
jgi:GNAT superfamily N-acetyltransferase